MKKMFFRTAIIAAFAMVLMAGSAMADGIWLNKYEEAGREEIGHFVAGGNATARRNDDGFLYAFTFNEYKRPSDDQSYDPMVYAKYEIATGIFKQYMPDSSWYSDGIAIPAFPRADTFEFRDSESLRFHDNLMVYNWIGGQGDDVFLGHTAGFNFYVTDFALDPTINSVGVVLALYGYVVHDDFGQLDAMYTVSFNNASQNDAEWGITFDVVVYDTPPEVPEPGTLVLLGTGLLGAAIIARKKMKK